MTAAVDGADGTVQVVTDELLAREPGGADKPEDKPAEPDQPRKPAVDLGPRYPSRSKRAKTGTADPGEGLGGLQSLLSTKRLLLFTGSGLSAPALATFSRPGGLYDRARKKYGLKEGIRLFYYDFFKARPEDCCEFLCTFQKEVVHAVPTAAHRALAQLARDGRLIRNYTMNIDGLHAEAGMSVWDSEEHPDGSVIEMHGSLRRSVCRSCGRVGPLDADQAAAFRARRVVPCGALLPAVPPAPAPTRCPGTIRPRVMLYADEEEGLMGDDFHDLLLRDAAQAEVVIWAGISFEQSASVAHFRRCRDALVVAGNASVPQLLVNSDADAFFNLSTALSNAEVLGLRQVLSTCDDALPRFLSG